LSGSEAQEEEEEEPPPPPPDFDLKRVALSLCYRGFEVEIRGGK